MLYRYAKQNNFHNFRREKYVYLIKCKILSLKMLITSEIYIFKEDVYYYVIL